MYPYFHDDVAPFTMSDSLCSFAPFPKALLNKGIRPSALLVYVALLDRATLSQKNRWCNGQGWIYVNYSVPHLSLDLGMGESTIRELLRVLEDQELIFRTYPPGGRGQRNLPAGAGDLPEAGKKFTRPRWKSRGSGNPCHPSGNLEPPLWKPGGKQTESTNLLNKLSALMRAEKSSFPHPPKGRVPPSSPPRGGGLRPPLTSS